MDAQEMHDLETRGRAEKMKVAGKEQLEALLAEKSSSSSVRSRRTGRGPIADMVAQNPGLTLEKALQMAEDLGF